MGESDAHSLLPQPDHSSIELASFTNQDSDKKVPWKRIQGSSSGLWRKSQRERFSGWRGGALTSAIICAVVLLINILLIIISVASWNPVDWIATAYTGDCSVAARQLTVAHLFINFLGSLLLGASNYCMQRLVAPTRKEVDSAHAKRKSLDVGVPSIRNLFSIAPLRAWIWVFLGLSSVPLHFMYNSIIFGTISSNYVTFNHTIFPQAIDALAHDIWDRDKYANLTNDECLRNYNSQFISKFGFGWALLETNNVSDNQEWHLENSGFGDLNLTGPYSYCISEIKQPRCEVQFSLLIMAIVIISNCIKLFLIIFILTRLNEETLVTIGDAIQSFLQSPDPTTKDCCLLSRYNIVDQWQRPGRRTVQRWNQVISPLWHTACTSRRWIVSSILTFFAVVPATMLIILDRLWRGERSKAWNGFGRVSTSHMFDLKLALGGTSMIPTVLVVNSPQVVMSFLYLLYNGLFTGMLAGHEWSSFATKHRLLRVTSPVPGQRSTHFLQLPYKWGLPLLAGSILLHWFVSQSIFLARISFYVSDEPYQPERGFIELGPNRDRSTKLLPVRGNVFTGIGFSDIALVASIACAILLIVVCRLVAGLLTFAKGPPVGGTSSAVISAACHTMTGDDQAREGDDIFDKPLKWGATIQGRPDRIGHLCFSDMEVEKPGLGYLYAGANNG
ncbi:hypothetical protein IQ07DRAFT_198771 [Pyrenochaeta sp. DS3sAY3a]|nr:hypothetical protein IQ07DRAFT_198771 [Pyrenochaeta sp. DS3sAY3a]